MLYQPTPYLFWLIINLDGEIIYYVTMMFCLSYSIYPSTKYKIKMCCVNAVL